MANLNDDDKSQENPIENPINDEDSKNIKKDASIEEELKNTEDKLLRALAEIENQRNRFEKEIKEAIDFGGFNFARENLAILDNLQRAHQSIKTDPSLKNSKDLDKFLKNLEIIEKDLLSIFKRNKIDRIDTKGKKFDPNFHQAMTEVKNDKELPGTIVQEIQAGYMFGSRLLRPSLVSVSKKSENIEEKNETKNKKKD